MNLCYLEPTKLFKKSPSPHIHINNEPLRQVRVAKYLGMYIDENLCWDHYIDTLVKKISLKIDIIRSLRNIATIDILKLMHNAIVLPHLVYADVVYDAASETNKSRLQRLANMNCSTDFWYRS